MVILCPWFTFEAYVTKMMIYIHISSYQSGEVWPLLRVATVANLVWPVRSSRLWMMLVPTTVPTPPHPLGSFWSF